MSEIDDGEVERCDNCGRKLETEREKELHEYCGAMI